MEYKSFSIDDDMCWVGGRRWCWWWGRRRSRTWMSRGRRRWTTTCCCYCIAHCIHRSIDEILDLWSKCFISKYFFRNEETTRAESYLHCNASKPQSCQPRTPLVWFPNPILLLCCFIAQETQQTSLIFKLFSHKCCFQAGWSIKFEPLVFILPLSLFELAQPLHNHCCSSLQSISIWAVSKDKITNQLLKVVQHILVKVRYGSGQ